MCVVQRLNYDCGHSTEHVLEKCNASVLQPGKLCEKHWRTKQFEDICPNCFAEQEAALGRATKRKLLAEQHREEEQASKRLKEEHTLTGRMCVMM